METIGNPWLWGGFAVVVVVALLADLVLMRHGGPHKVTFGEALYWSAGWVVLALAFNAGLWWYVTETGGAALGNKVGLEFLTGYVVEKSLAVDNIFVFLTESARRAPCGRRRLRRLYHSMHACLPIAWGQAILRESAIGAARRGERETPDVPRARLRTSRP